MGELLRCGKLVDGSGKPSKSDMAIYIENSVITEVAPWDQVPAADKNHSLIIRILSLSLDLSTRMFTCSLLA